MVTCFVDVQLWDKWNVKGFFSVIMNREILFFLFLPHPLLPVSALSPAATLTLILYLQ